ncbi:MAG: response regulator [Kordiimonadaceae bacterium]|nr:response regulator [Kordiimonadaceae bacterium]
MISVLIVDDEPLARENIMLRLNKELGFFVCGQADNGSDAIVLAASLQPDIIFLDIQMPGVDGLVVAENIRETSETEIVFVTAYDSHALDAFRLNALNYLVKPIDDTEFKDTLERIKIRVEATRAACPTKIPRATGKLFLKRLAIKDGKTMLMLDVASIECIEAAGDYLCLQASGEGHIQRQTLTSLLSVLDPEIFLRIHRSHAVNINFIAELSEADQGVGVVLKTGRQLQVSRRFQKTVREFLSRGT